VINVIRAHLAEFGIVAPAGRHGVEQLLSVAADSNDKRLPELALLASSRLREQVIDVLRRLIKSAVRAGRRDSIALGIENRDPITVVALVVKYKLVSVIAMCAGYHAKRSVSFFASPANR
jgi:hypothetical protein